jgi:hypothetical protein
MNMTTIKNLLCDHPGLAFLTAFVATLSYGLVKLAALLSAYGA